MKRGYCVGTKRERKNASDWYAVIEAATLATLEAQEPARCTLCTGTEFRANPLRLYQLECTFCGTPQR